SRKTFEENIDRIVVKKVKSSNLLNDNFESAKWNVFTKTYLNDVIKNSSSKPNSFIENHINQNSSHELKKLNIPFDYAKPSSLIKYLIEIAKVKDNDIILDFFSGSATTADAILQGNIEDNLNRKFIMVQIPEILDKKKNAYQFCIDNNFETNICSIGKERIRRAGELIKEENKDKEGIDKLDIGFKVFKLDSSNIVEWDSEAILDEKSIWNHSDVFKADRSDFDIFYEILLKYGIFDKDVSEVSINNKLMYRVGKNAVIICLDNNITIEDVDAIALEKPLKVIFKESGFSDDNDKINATYNLTRNGVEDIKCV
ncbi:MAG: DNA methyltransferase, partial [Bacilli bacterium]